MYTSIALSENEWYATKTNHLSIIPGQNTVRHVYYNLYRYFMVIMVFLSTVLEMIYDLDKRKEWDRQFPVIEVVEEHKHYRVVYW